MYKANGIAEDFKTRVMDAEKNLERISADLADAATGYYKTSKKYVRENPAKSIALAALVGAFAGTLFTVACTKNR